PCSIAAQQRHKIIGKGLALVGEESVSGSRRNRRRVNQEHPLMRVYIIGNDGITLRRKAPAAVNDGEIAVASNRRAARCSAQRQAVAGTVERSARCRKAKESWRPRCAARSTVVGNRGLAGPGAATRPEAPLQAGGGDCDAASARGGDGRRGGERDRLAASYGSRRLLGNLEEKARAHSCLGQRGARPGLPHRRAGE